MQGRLVQTQNRVGERDVRNEERDFWQVMKGRVMDRGPWRWGGGWLVAISKLKIPLKKKIIKGIFKRGKAIQEGKKVNGKEREPASISQETGRGGGGYPIRKPAWLYIPGRGCAAMLGLVGWSQKESQNSRNQGFSYYFCMMIEGSGSGSRKHVDPVDPDPQHCF